MWRHPLPGSSTPPSALASDADRFCARGSGPVAAGAIEGVFDDEAETLRGAGIDAGIRELVAPFAWLARFGIERVSRSFFSADDAELTDIRLNEAESSHRPVA